MSKRDEIEAWFKRGDGMASFIKAVERANPGSTTLYESVRKAVRAGYLRPKWFAIAVEWGGEENPPDPTMFNFDAPAPPEKTVGNGEPEGLAA